MRSFDTELALFEQTIDADRRAATVTSNQYNVGPALALTLFDGGARRAVKDQAVAGYDEMADAYRQTVLAAFQDVEDNLAAQRLLADEAEREQTAVAAAQRSLDSARRSH